MNLKKLTFGLTLIASSVSLTGCFGPAAFQANVKPTSEPYGFAFKEPTLRRSVGDIYPDFNVQEIKFDQGTETFSALVRFPEKHVICFNGNDTGYGLPVKNELNEEAALKFINGMYPFSLYKQITLEDGTVETDCGSLETPRYVGAMAFFDYEQDMEFATFGADEETALISNEIINKVSEGILGSHTISYDNKARIKYWVGNRSTLYSGGNANAEVDFRNANLKSLKINGEEVPTMQATLDIYEQSFDDYGNIIQKKKQHKLEFTTSDGKKFGGYLKELQDNEYTAYMKIPCEIPADLFEAANKGTVSKFDVMSKSEQGSTRIAQIVFGRRH